MDWKSIPGCIPFFWSMCPAATAVDTKLVGWMGGWKKSRENVRISELSRKKMSSNHDLTGFVPTKCRSYLSKPIPAGKSREYY